MLTLVILVMIGAAVFVAYKITKKEDVTIETKVVAPEKVEPAVVEEEAPVKKEVVKKAPAKKMSAKKEK